MTAEANNNLDYDETPREPALDYHALNAKLNLVGDDGKLQLDADHEAARQFFLQHVNHNTVYFDDLEKKIDYLITNHYYEREFIEQYDWAFVKDLYKRAYSYKFRFPTFMGAFKYYSSYTLKTFDGKRYLERYEDRVVANALYLGRGNQELATSILDEIMTGRYQPATPTFLNAGKAQRGELVSCFPYDTPIDTIDGQKKIGDVQPGDKVLSHDGRYHAVTDKIVNKNSKNLVSIKHYGHKEPITSTPEHPILIWTTRKQTSLIDGDGADENNGFVWVEAKNVMPGDFIVSSHPVDVRPVRTIDLMDYIDDPSVTSEGGVIKKRNTDKKYSKKEKYSNRFWAVNRFISEDYNLGLILGWYLSEGYVSKRESKQGRVPNGVHFTLGRHERDFQNELMEAINNVFGVEAKINDSKYDASTKISVHSSLIGSLLLQMAGTGYNRKTLKYDVMSANHSFQHGLLHGLFRGDGHTTNGALILDLVNPPLVDSVHLILSRLGIISRVRTYVNQKGNKTGQVVVPGIAGENEHFIYNVNKNIRNYVGLRGGKNNFKNKEFHKYVDGRLVYEVEHVETTSDTPETVYNLEVEDTHTYTIRGSVVHNCFLTRVEDNLESISRAITNALQLSKRGGGVALLLTNIRETGAPIKRIENQSSGIVPVMKLLEDSFSYANQLGARQGAGAVYLSAHHPDIMKFLDTKRENADEKIRIKTLSLGVVIPDITFELAKNNDDMYLFSPYDVERVYGTPMSDISITEKYHEMVENPDIRKTKIKARRLFQVISEISMESGYPYLLFEDTATKANPLNGRINMSNLCSEILQTNEASEYNPNGSYSHVGKDISCNLGSLNIAKTFDSPDFAKTIETGIRALTSVSDLSNIDAVPSVENGNHSTHSIGLGMMNLHGFLAREHIHYDSPEAVEFAGLFAYAFNYWSIVASNKIAKETGQVFDGFDTSEYANGTYFNKYIEKNWGHITSPKISALLGRSSIYLPTQADWEKLKNDVMEHGLYNGYRLCIPPTGSISYLNYSTASIHPIISPIEIRKEGKLGRVYAPAPYLSDDTLPFYRDAYKIGPEAIINIYAAMTPHIDQGLSLTLFWPDTATTRDMNKAYIYAWRKGIKTIYYARIRQLALEGTQVEGTAAGYCESCQL